MMLLKKVKGHQTEWTVLRHSNFIMKNSIGSAFDYRHVSAHTTFILDFELFFIEISRCTVQVRAKLLLYYIMFKVQPLSCQ